MISTGSQGDKKESRARKRASSAVREMTKLSHEKRKEKEDSTSLVMANNSRSKSTTDSLPQSSNDSKEGGEEYTDPQGVTTKQKRDRTPSCDAEDGEKGNLLYKKAYLIYDTLTPKDIGSSKSRTRRVRKQPTLYDPQTCPASEWTDSKKRLADCRNNMEENDNDNTKSKTSENEKCCEVRKVKNGISGALIKYTDTNALRTANVTPTKPNPSALWCYYCKDSNIVCLFCACRVCYSKHDEKNILICDSCDEEYHIYCLDPPLTTVPKDKWFCPTCKKGDECSKDVKKVESEEPTIKVKPSPPASTLPLPLKRSTRKLSQQVKCTNSEQQKHPTNERLKSNDDETDEISLSKLFRDSSKLKKDGNEKKRKAPTSPPNTQPNTQKEKKLQRPSSSHSTPPLQKSRSGRTVKPQIFFDEMAERDQHQLLKSNHTQKNNSDEQQHQKKKKKSIATTPRPADAPRRGRPPKNSKSPPSDRMATTTVGASKQQNLIYAKSSAQIPIKSTVGASSAQDNETSSLSGAVSGSRKISNPSTSKPSSSSSIIKEDTSLVHDVPGKNVVQKPVDLNNNNVSHQTPAASRPQTTTVTSPESNDIPVPDHNSHINPVHSNVSTPQAEHYLTPTKDTPISMATIPTPKSESSTPGQQTGKIPRRKPGARECMQISRRWGVQRISQKYMDTLLNYCTRGKVEHLIRMRERLDEHSLMLESQLAGLSTLIAEHGGAEIELFGEGDRNLNGAGSLSSECTVTPVNNIHEDVTHENSNGSSVATNPQAQAQITSDSHTQP